MMLVMPAQEKTCRLCESTFTLQPGKPGYADVCPACTEDDVPLLMAKVSWEGKHSPVIEITDNRDEAERFNKAQGRGCHGPLSALSGGRNKQDKEAGKASSGAEKGAIYHTPMGEKFSIKR